MTAKPDYSSEIIGLIALTALSALSHFWYILIAICAAIAVVGTGFWVSGILLRLRKDLLERLLTRATQSNLRTESEVSVNAATQSLPVA